jgi:hypothetical protein
VFCDDAVTTTPADRARFTDDPGSVTVTDTVSTAVVCPSDTVNRKVCTPNAVGVNVGFAADVLLNTTPGPAVCAH